MNVQSKPKIRITLIDQKGEHGCHCGHKIERAESEGRMQGCLYKEQVNT